MLRSRRWIVPCVTFSLFRWLEASARACGCATRSPNLNATATINPNCTVMTTPVAFGAYDPIGLNHSTPLDSTGGIELTCNYGVTATISMGQGLNPAAGSTGALPIRQMSDGDGHLLAYTLNQDAARLEVWGDTQETSTCTSGSLVVYGRVAAGQNAMTGTYYDTVVVVVIL